MGKSQTSLDHGPTNIQHCKQCDAELVPHARFCSVCGAIAESMSAQATSQKVEEVEEVEEYGTVPKWQSIGKPVAAQSSASVALSNVEVTKGNETLDDADGENEDFQEIDFSSAEDTEDEEEDNKKSHTQPHLSAVIANIGRRPETEDTPAPAQLELKTFSTEYGIEDYDTMMLSSYAPLPKPLIHEALTERSVAVQPAIESQPTSALSQLPSELDMVQTQRIPSISTVGRKAAPIPVEQRETQHMAAPALSERGSLESTYAANVAPEIWPVILVVAAIATALLVYVVPGLPIRPYVVLAFLILCPGMALIRLLRLRDVAVEWTLAIALSIVLDASIPTIQLYAHLWSPDISLDIILCITAIAALAQFIDPRPRTRSKIKAA